jgi:hypothetical protein
MKKKIVMYVITTYFDLLSWFSSARNEKNYKNRNYDILCLTISSIKKL